MKKTLLFLCVLGGMTLVAQSPREPHDHAQKKQHASTTTRAHKPAKKNHGAKKPWCDGELSEKHWLCYDSIASLSVAENKEFNSMILEHNTYVKPKKRMYDSLTADLKIMVESKGPDMVRIEKTLDEVGEIEKNLKLEMIRFRIKVLKRFPELEKSHTPHIE